MNFETWLQTLSEYADKECEGCPMDGRCKRIEYGDVWGMPCEAAPLMYAIQATLRHLYDEMRRPRVSEQAELRECPFCGGKDLHIAHTRVYWVICSCGAQSASRKTKAAAIAAWNQRAAPKPAPEALHGYWHVEPIQPGDPCEECKPTNRCPIQNPCPVKQIWLEGKEGKQ